MQGGDEKSNVIYPKKFPKSWEGRGKDKDEVLIAAGRVDQSVHEKLLTAEELLYHAREIMKTFAREGSEMKHHPMVKSYSDEDLASVLSSSKRQSGVAADYAYSVAAEYIKRFGGGDATDSSK